MKGYRTILINLGFALLGSLNLVHPEWGWLITPILGILAPSANIALRSVTTTPVGKGS